MHHPGHSFMFLREKIVHLIFFEGSEQPGVTGGYLLVHELVNHFDVRGSPCYPSKRR